MSVSSSHAANSAETTDASKNGSEIPHVVDMHRATGVTSTLRNSTPYLMCISKSATSPTAFTCSVHRDSTVTVVTMLRPIYAKLAMKHSMPRFMPTTSRKRSPPFSLKRATVETRVSTRVSTDIFLTHKPMRPITSIKDFIPSLPLDSLSKTVRCVLV